jgi:hypothetical protein
MVELVPRKNVVFPESAYNSMVGGHPPSLWLFRQIINRTQYLYVLIGRTFATGDVAILSGCELSVTIVTDGVSSLGRLVSNPLFGGDNRRKRNVFISPIRHSSITAFVSNYM